jgi:hypothetical protein
MKRVLSKLVSKIVLVSGLLLGVSAVSTSMAAGPVKGPAKPDAAHFQNSERTSARRRSYCFPAEPALASFRAVRSITD